MRADVIVVGLGSMGAAAAYQLAARGVRVLGVDRFTPPHPEGAHTGGSRIIRLAYAEGADYVPLLRRAYDLWRDLELAGGVSLLAPTGGLMLGRPDSPFVAGALASARAHGLDHERLDAAGVRRRFPAFAPADDEIGVYEEVAGVLRPEAAVATLLDLAGTAGAELRYDVPVTGWHAGPSGVTVRTASGDLTAGHLVLCPGAGATDLLTDLDVPMRVERRVQHYWSSLGPDFAPDRFPVWIWASGPTVAAYGMPALPASATTESVPTAFETAPGTGSETGWAAPGPVPGWDQSGTVPVVKTAFHTAGPFPADDLGEVRPAESRAMLDWLASRLPALAKATWLGGRPCRYTLTPDEHFLLGPHPEHPRVTVAAGFSGHGFKFVPVIGEILADLAQTGTTGHRIDLFAPHRFTRTPGR